MEIAVSAFTPHPCCSLSEASGHLDLPLHGIGPCLLSRKSGRSLHEDRRALVSHGELHPGWAACYRLSGELLEMAGVHIWELTPRTGPLEILLKSMEVNSSVDVGWNGLCDSAAHCKYLELIVGIIYE